MTERDTSTMCTVADGVFVCARLQKKAILEFLEWQIRRLAAGKLKLKLEPVVACNKSNNAS